MHVKAGVAIEPSGDRGMFMGSVIVGDDVDVEITWGLFIDGFEKGQPLLMAVARRQTGDQLALEIIERGFYGGFGGFYPGYYGYGYFPYRYYCY